MRRKRFDERDFLVRYLEISRLLTSQFGANLMSEPLAPKE